MDLIGVIKMFKKIICAVLLIGVVHVMLYFGVLSIASTEGMMVSLQPDTLLYCQAARRICEGYPFSYSIGEAVSTGTTSVLYPFVLAIPYALGAQGYLLIVAGFVLNAFFYLVFLSGWTLAGWRWCSEPKSKWFFPLLLALAAQPAYCAFGQTDVGLWLAESALFVAAMAWQRWRCLAVLSMLAPWLRPEGSVLAVALLLMVPLMKEHRRQVFTIAILALCSTIAVFGFNELLTGRFQFDSVAHKGYFKNCSFAEALSLTATDIVELLKDYFLGVPRCPPHVFFFVPILTAVFFWVGSAIRDWKESLKTGFCMVALAVVGSFLLVASSGWKGLNFDRYLVWTTPLFSLVIADGCVRLSELTFLRRVRYFPCSLVVVYSLFGLVTSLAIATKTGRGIAAGYEYDNYCEQLMAEEDRLNEAERPRSVGGIACGSAYFLRNRRFYHLAGLYSPDFFDYYRIETAFELLKYRTDLRPTYWLSEGMEGLVPSSARDKVFGRLLAIGPGGDDPLRVAEWSAFDTGASVPVAPVGKLLTARLDIGYLPDEKSSDYKVIDRWGLEPRKIFLAVEKRGEDLAVDAGRIIRGGDMMTIPLQPGKDCEVIVRTLSSRDGFEFNSPIKMLLNVDGEDVGYVGYDLNLKTNAFQEVSFTIPGAAIHQSPSRLGFLGDHIACGYWFYQ